MTPLLKRRRKEVALMAVLMVFSLINLRTSVRSDRFLRQEDDSSYAVIVVQESVDEELKEVYGRTINEKNEDTLRTRDALERESHDKTTAKANPHEPTTPLTTTTDMLTATGIQLGIQSTKPPSFFQTIQQEIDDEDWQMRCRRFGPLIGSTHGSTPQNRRIFYGSLVGDEPWELFAIMGTETYGIFAGMVFVESNRTQNFSPRPQRHNQHTKAKLQELFGVSQLQIRHYINEDRNLQNLYREHAQRQEILKAWKEMGMGPEDIGYIADVDETFSRSFLRAAQTCPYVAPFQYENHKCHNGRVRLSGRGTVYEGSPDCVTSKRQWDKPDMILGACLEEIGNATEHPWAKRRDNGYGYQREIGYGTGFGNEKKGSPEYQKHYANITGDHYPLWSAGDVRMQGGGVSVPRSAFHLHNWFPDFTKTRTKYNTYGHAVRNAMTKPLHDIHPDLKLLAYCVRNRTDAPTSSIEKGRVHKEYKYTELQDFQRVVGGLDASQKPWPIYFYDEEYRRRKQQAVRVKLEEDQKKREAQMSPDELEHETTREHLREIKRQVWRHEYQGRLDEAKHLNQKARTLEKEFVELNRRLRAKQLEARKE